MKYLLSSNSLEEDSPIKVERIVVPASLKNDNGLKKLMAQQPDTIEDEELDQSSLQTFEKMNMQDDFTSSLNESYN